MRTLPIVQVQCFIEGSCIHTSDNRVGVSSDSSTQPRMTEPVLIKATVDEFEQGPMRQSLNINTFKESAIKHDQIIFHSCLKSNRFNRINLSDSDRLKLKDDLSQERR